MDTVTSEGVLSDSPSSSMEPNCLVTVLFGEKDYHQFHPLCSVRDILPLFRSAVGLRSVDHPSKMVLVGDNVVPPGTYTLQMPLQLPSYSQPPPPPPPLAPQPTATTSSLLSSSVQVDTNQTVPVKEKKPRGPKHTFPPIDQSDVEQLVRLSGEEPTNYGCTLQTLLRDGWAFFDSRDELNFPFELSDEAPEWGDYQPLKTFPVDCTCDPESLTRMGCEHVYTVRTRKRTVYEKRIRGVNIFDTAGRELHVVRFDVGIFNTAKSSKRKGMEPNGGQQDKDDKHRKINEHQHSSSSSSSSSTTTGQGSEASFPDSVFNFNTCKKQAMFDPRDHIRVVRSRRSGTPHRNADAGRRKENKRHCYRRMQKPASSLAGGILPEHSQRVGEEESTIDRQESVTYECCLCNVRYMSLWEAWSHLRSRSHVKKRIKHGWIIECVQKKGDAGDMC